MKNIILCIIALAPLAVFSQVDILDRARDKVKSRTNQRIDREMDKSLDKAEEKVFENNKSKPEGKSQHIQAYSRYDYIPGDQIIYAEDFLADEIGELPLKWTTNNRGETVTVKNKAGKWMRLFPGSRFASPSFKKLPENFTVEMDLLLQFDGEGGYVYPELELKLLELAGATGTRSFVVDQEAANEVALTLLPGGTDKPMYAALKSYANGAGHFSNDPKELKLISDNGGNVIHVSVWVQKERVRYWINENKIFDIPLAIPPNAGFNHIGFSLESSVYDESQLGMYISNHYCPTKIT